MTFQITSSIPSKGYGSLAYTGKYVGATKQPPFSFEPPKNLNYFIGRWETDGKSLSNFKKIQLGDGKTQLMMSGLVALANQFFLAYQNAVGFQPTKIYAYDPETLNVTATSNEIQAPACMQLQAANGMLFFSQSSTLLAYDPQFNPLFQISLDSTAFQIPFFAFTSDQIVCTSCNGAVATYDYKGNSTSDTLFFNDHGANPWIVTTGDDLAVIGFYDMNNGLSYFQAWALKPLAKVGPEYAIVDEYTGSAVNTAAGVLLAGAKVLALGSYPAFEPNYTLYTFPKSIKINCEIDLIDPQTIVTVDDQIQIWKYTPGAVPSAQGAFALQQVTPAQVASAAAPWTVIGSFDLSSIVKDNAYWSIIGIDANHHLFMYEQNSQTLYQMVLDGSQITLGKSHLFEGEGIFVNLFLAGGHLFASVQNAQTYSSFRLNPTTLEAEDIQIANQIYPLDDKTFAGLYNAPLRPGFTKHAPKSTLTVYNAANLQVITSFNISAGAPNLNKMGETLIGVQGSSIRTYDRQGKVIAHGLTGFKNSINNTGAIPVDDAHFLVGYDDNYRQESTVQLWQINPLQQVSAESYQMGNFDITSISPTPQGTILAGKQGIEYVGPNPNFSAFATIVKDPSGNNVVGSCLSLPNNQAVVLNGNSLQLYQIGQQEAPVAATKPWCTVQ